MSRSSGGAKQRHGASLVWCRRMAVIESHGDPRVGVVVEPVDLAGVAVERTSEQTSYWRKKK